jgi:hypothetical protein
MRYELSFLLARKTPGALVFQEVDAEGEALTTKDPHCTVGTLYIRKSALGDDVPKALAVVIETSDAAD